jgi:hypothetical protein
LSKRTDSPGRSRCDPAVSELAAPPGSVARQRHADDLDLARARIRERRREEAVVVDRRPVDRHRRIAVEDRLRRVERERHRGIGPSGIRADLGDAMLDTLGASAVSTLLEDPAQQLLGLDPERVPLHRLARAGDRGVEVVRGRLRRGERDQARRAQLGVLARREVVEADVRGAVAERLVEQQIPRRPLDRALVVRERRHRKEAVAKQQLAQQVVVERAPPRSERAPHGVEVSVAEPPGRDPVLPPGAEAIQRERVGMVDALLPVVAFGVIEEVLPRLDQIDPPPTVAPLEQDRHEAVGGVVGVGDRVVAPHRHAQRLRRLGAVEPIELFERRVGVAGELAARARCVEVERRISDLLALRAQVGFGAGQRIRRRGEARSLRLGNDRLEIAIPLLRERELGLRSGPAGQVAGLLEELGRALELLRKREVSRDRLQIGIVLQELENVHHGHARNVVGGIRRELARGDPADDQVRKDVLERIGHLDPRLAARRVQQHEQAARPRARADSPPLEDLLGEGFDPIGRIAQRDDVDIDAEIVAPAVDLPRERAAESAEHAGRIGNRIWLRLERDRVDALHRRGLPGAPAQGMRLPGPVCPREVPRGQESRFDRDDGEQDPSDPRLHESGLPLRVR